MSTVRITGAALLSAMLLLLLRELRPSTAPPLRMAVSLLFLGGALTLLSPAIHRLNALLATTQGESYTPVLLTAVGISFATELGAALCRDLGENGVGDALLFFGRAEILLLSLPLVDQLIDLAREMLSW